MSVENEVRLSGHLGASPELKYTSSGRAVCNMRLATTRKYTNNSGQLVEDTQWHRIIFWGKQAETCAKYLEKGREVTVVGRLQTRQWEDKDKVKRWTTEVVGEAIRFHGGATKKSEEEVPNFETYDDVPF